MTDKPLPCKHDRGRDGQTAAQPTGDCSPMSQTTDSSSTCRRLASPAVLENQENLKRRACARAYRYPQHPERR